jgi:hypothetical protein
MGEAKPALLCDLIEEAARARRLADVIWEHPAAADLDAYAKELDAEIQRRLARFRETDL